MNTKTKNEGLVMNGNQPHSNELTEISNKLKTQQMNTETKNDELVMNSNQTQKDVNENMKVVLYNIIDIDIDIEIMRKFDELEYLHKLHGLYIDINDLRLSILDEIRGDNFIPLSNSDWNEFKQKYIWSFFIKQGFSIEEITVDEMIGDSEKMILLLEYLNSFEHVQDLDKKIIEFFNKNKNGVIPIS